MHARYCYSPPLRARPPTHSFKQSACALSCTRPPTETCHARRCYAAQCTPSAPLCPRRQMTIAFAALALVAVAAAAPRSLPMRHMSPDRISGFYALQETLPTFTATCARTVAFSSHSQSDEGIAVVHSSVRLGGASCMGDAALAIAPADHAFENPLYASARRTSLAPCVLFGFN